MSGVTVLCGGVGAARFLRGLLDVVDPTEVTAVVNVADDTVLHGLEISPDLDTITYTLAGAIDPERGWGLLDETWSAMAQLRGYATSAGLDATDDATGWFSLGDRDLGTHLYRTSRRRAGATLSEVTAEIARAWGLATAHPSGERRPAAHRAHHRRRAPTVLPAVLRARTPRRSRAFGRGGGRRPGPTGAGGAGCHRGGRRRGGRPVEPGGVDRPGPGGPRRARRARRRPTAHRRGEPDRRRRGAQGTGRPPAARARTPCRRGRRGPLVRTVGLDPGDRRGRRCRPPDEVAAEGIAASATATVMSDPEVAAALARHCLAVVGDGAAA